MWGATETWKTKTLDGTISIHAPRVGSDFIFRFCGLDFLISIHAPRVGSDDRSRCKGHCSGYFNPRSPCGERRYSGLRCMSWTAYFNPRSPCGERRDQHCECKSADHFNPRSPCGERHRARDWSNRCLMISIHAPRVGSDLIITISTLRISISIHAPRVGSDFVPNRLTWKHWEISIHAPRVGSDYDESKAFKRTTRFQSTLPVWGATMVTLFAYLDTSFQSTLPVWGATTALSCPKAASAISIHAPRVGSDGFL